MGAFRPHPGESHSCLLLVRGVGGPGLLALGPIHGEPAFHTAGLRCACEPGEDPSRPHPGAQPSGQPFQQAPPTAPPKPPGVLLASLSLSASSDINGICLHTPRAGVPLPKADLTAHLHLPAAPALAGVDGPQRGHLLQAKPWCLDSARQPHACPCDRPSWGAWGHFHHRQGSRAWPAGLRSSRVLPWAREVRWPCH